MLYSTLDEATRREVVEPIEGFGVVVDAGAEFDVDAIAAEAIEFTDGHDPVAGVYRLNRAGFRLALTPDEFWAVVEAHAYEVAA